MTAQALPATKLLAQAQSARRNGAHDCARALYREVLARGTGWTRWIVPIPMRDK